MAVAAVLPTALKPRSSLPSKVQVQITDDWHRFVRQTLDGLKRS